MSAVSAALPSSARGRTKRRVRNHLAEDVQDDGVIGVVWIEFGRRIDKRRYDASCAEGDTRANFPEDKPSMLTNFPEL